MNASTFSRNGKTGPFGKNNVEIKTQVSDEVVNAVTEYASLNAVPRAEAHRTLLEDGLFGRMVHLPRHYLGKQPMTQRDAINVLAALKGVSPEEYIEHAMTEHLFGRLHADRMRLEGDEEQTVMQGGNPAAQGERANG